MEGKEEEDRDKCCCFKNTLRRRICITVVWVHHVVHAQSFKLVIFLKIYFNTVDLTSQYKVKLREALICETLKC